MPKKIVLELDKNLTDGELLIYKDGKIKSVEVHELLPDLIQALTDIENQGKAIGELQESVAELARIAKGELE